MTTYLQFIRSYPSILGLSVLHTFFSGIGQTFFIAIFVPHLMIAFVLSRSEFGFLYSLVTLCSASLLPFVGAWIDRINLYKYSTVNALFMTASCLLAAASYSIWMFIPALFLMRFTGQSLMSHIASTSMSRYFHKNRGKALSLSNLGFPASEAVLPVITLWIITVYGWRGGYMAIAAMMISVFLPVSWILFRKNPDLQSPSGTAAEEVGLTPKISLTRKEALKTPLLYQVLPAAITPAFLITGFLFHQSALSELFPQWDQEWMAGGLLGFAISRAVMSFIVGPMIDRLSATRLFRFYLCPVAVGAALMFSGSSAWWGVLFFCGAGMSVGLGQSLTSALFAEVYGTIHLGSIRSLQITAVIFSTAASPWLFGVLLDKGYTMHAIARDSVILIVFVIALAWKIQSTKISE